MKIPWIRLIVTGVILLLVIGAIHYFSKQLPPSKVNLAFKGWSKAGTNTYAKFDLINTGPRSIHWNLDGAVIFEMEMGWITNRFEHFGCFTLGTPPGSNETVFAEIPMDSRRWMIRVDYSSFQKHNVKLETIQKIYATSPPRHLPDFVSNFMFSILALFPNPKEEYHEIFSQVFTNKPLDGPVETIKSR